MENESFNDVYRTVNASQEISDDQVIQSLKKEGKTHSMSDIRASINELLYGKYKGMFKRNSRGNITQEI